MAAPIAATLGAKYFAAEGLFNTGKAALGVVDAGMNAAQTLSSQVKNTGPKLGSL